jgi:K+-transporting ATPase c subunit
MRRQLIPALVLFVAFTVLVGLLYPLLILGSAMETGRGRKGRI